MAGSKPVGPKDGSEEACNRETRWPAMTHLRLLITLGALSALLFVTATRLKAEEPSDPHGWDKAKWGMTKAQIVAAFDGKPHMAQDKIMAIAGIESKLLTLEEFLISNMKFRVHFAFDEKGGLRQVLLRPIGDPKIVPKPAYSNVESALTEKYGKPSKVDHQQFRGIATTAEWLFPTTLIRIGLLDNGKDVGGDMSFDCARRDHPPI
jgi:hypothetical protein